MSSRGRDRTSNLLIQSQAFCRLNYPRPFGATVAGAAAPTAGGDSQGPGRTGIVVTLMGSLIKKRRKRMRKKKHKKMLKRTRFQRRAKGK